LPSVVPGTPVGINESGVVSVTLDSELQLAAGVRAGKQRSSDANESTFDITLNSQLQLGAKRKQNSAAANSSDGVIGDEASSSPWGPSISFFVYPHPLLRLLGGFSSRTVPTTAYLGFSAVAVLLVFSCARFFTYHSKRSDEEQFKKQAEAMGLGAQSFSAGHDADGAGSQAGGASAAKDLPLPPLCPEVMVPPSCECSVLVPCLVGSPISGSLLPKRAGGAAGEQPKVLTVEDCRGLSVFRATLAIRHTELPTATSIREPVGLRCLTLASTSGGTIFALVRGRCDRRSLQLFSRTNKLYGDLEPLEPAQAGSSSCSFCLSTKQGQRIIFQGDAGMSTLTATVDGRLLAILEAPADPAEIGHRRSVVVGPSVDAGVIVACIIAIDWLHNGGDVAAVLRG
jgi:hypothetical protein